MQDSSQNMIIHGDTIPVAEAQQVQQTVTTVAVPEKLHDPKKDFNAAVQVTGIAMVAIFAFMLIFFLVIKGIDKVFPHKED